MAFLKGSLRAFASYSAGVFLFTFFLIAPLSMENNRNTWIAVYSLVFFVFTVIFLFKQIRKTGEEDIRKLEGGAAPLRGAALGFVGFLPYLILELIYFIFYPRLGGTSGANILHAIFRCGFGPMYFIIRFSGYSWYSYVISSLIIPVVTFLGYVSGIKGKSLSDVILTGKRDEEDFLSD